MKDIFVMRKSDQKVYSLAVEVIYGKLTISQFSILAGKSYRQSQRIIKRVKESGVAGLQHGNSGRKPWNRTSQYLEQRILELLATQYNDFNLTHFREKLLEDHGISIGRETLRRWATKKNLVKKAKRRRKKRSHKPRPRMPRIGMLVQFDGSEHAWLGRRMPIYTMIGGLDDATGEILYLELFPVEDTFNCMKSIREIIERHGVPESFFLDCAGHFGKPYAEQDRTQIGRALNDLNCKVIFAFTPQAKGRVERLWGTLQDRLVAEFRLKKIRGIRQANNFLVNDFIPRYNKQFAKPPREKESSFRVVEPWIRLERIFCIQEKRRISSGNVFSYQGKKYVVDCPEQLRYRYITILAMEDGSIDFELLGEEVRVYEATTDKQNAENAA